MEATRQTFAPDSIVITRREDGFWDAVAVVAHQSGVVGELKVILTDARFTLEAEWSPGRSYIHDFICEPTQPPRVVAYRFGMNSNIEPVTYPSGSQVFLESRKLEGGCGDN